MYLKYNNDKKYLAFKIVIGFVDKVTVSEEVYSFIFGAPLIFAYSAVSAFAWKSILHPLFILQNAQSRQIVQQVTQIKENVQIVMFSKLVFCIYFANSLPPQL